MVNLVTLHDPTCTAMEVDWGPFQTVLIVMVGFIHIASGATAFVAHFQIPINEQKQQPTTFIYIINFTISALFTLQSIPIMFHNYSPLFQSLQFVLHNIMGKKNYVQSNSDIHFLKFCSVAQLIYNNLFIFKKS